MTDAATIAASYIALWNEPDPVRRLTMLANGWTEDAAYTDPLANATGHGEISALIAGAQERFPGFRFALDGKADGHGNHVRFSWTLGPPEDPGLIKGTDFVITDGQRLRSVFGFLDKVPAHS